MFFVKGIPGTAQNKSSKILIRRLPYMMSAKFSDCLTPPPPCHIQKSADFIPFVCFLGTPHPLRTSYMFLSQLCREPSAKRPHRPTCTRASSRWTSTPRRSSRRRPTGPTSTPSPPSGSGTRPAANPPSCSE